MKTKGFYPIYLHIYIYPIKNSNVQALVARTFGGAAVAASTGRQINWGSGGGGGTHEGSFVGGTLYLKRCKILNIILRCFKYSVVSFVIC